jgi:hypothetical protein
MHPKAATFIVPNKPKMSTLFSGEEPAGRAFSDEYVNVTLTPKHVPVSATAASAGQSRRATAFGPLRDDTQLPPAALPPAPKAALNVAFVDDDDDNDDDDPPPPPASEYASTSAALARHASAGEDNYSSTAAVFAAMNAAAQAAAGGPGSSSANYSSIQPLAGTAPRSEYTTIQPLESRTAEYTGLAANEFFVAPQKPLPQRTPARGRGSPAAPPSPTPSPMPPMGAGSAARGLPARRGVPVTAALATVRRPPAPLGSTHPPLSAPPSVPPSSSQQQQQQQQQQQHQQAPAAPPLPSWDVRNAGDASTRRAPLRRADSDDIEPPPPPPADASDSPAAAPRRVITYEQFPRRNQQYVSLGPEGIKPIADAPAATAAAPPVSSRKPAPVAAAPNQYGSIGHVLAPLNYATLSQSEQVTPARK